MRNRQQAPSSCRSIGLSRKVPKKLRAFPLRGRAILALLRKAHRASLRESRPQGVTIPNADPFKSSQFLHQVVGFDEDGDDFAIVFDVVVSERTVFAILEPLLSGLIAADIEVPR